MIIISHFGFCFRSKKIYAIIEGVDVLITGDKDFDDVEVEIPEIMTIAEFEKEYMVH